MKIPKAVRVGHLTYPIKNKPVILNEYMQGLRGQADLSDRTITLKEDLTAEDGFSTLWHEVLHCIEDNFNLNLTEREIDNLSHGICQVLIDNPCMRQPNGAAKGSSK